MFPGTVDAAPFAQEVVGDAFGADDYVGGAEDTEEVEGPVGTRPGGELEP